MPADGNLNEVVSLLPTVYPLLLSNKLVLHELLLATFFALILRCPQLRGPLCSVHARDVLEHIRLFHFEFCQLVTNEVLYVVNELHIVLQTQAGRSILKGRPQ
jgi:hypothetical protein